MSNVKYRKELVAAYAMIGVGVLTICGMVSDSIRSSKERNERRKRFYEDCEQTLKRIEQTEEQMRKFNLIKKPAESIVKPLPNYWAVLPEEIKSEILVNREVIKAQEEQVRNLMIELNRYEKKYGILEP